MAYLNFVVIKSSLGGGHGIKKVNFKSPETVGITLNAVATNSPFH